MDCSNDGRTTVRRLGLCLLVLALTASVILDAGAHATGNGYSDNFEYANVPAPLKAGVSDPWQVSFGSWIVEARPDPSNPLGTMKALSQKNTAGPPSDPIAFVRNRNFSQLIVQVRAGEDKHNRNSGIGVVFRAPVDPNTGLADRRNLYLFTTVKTGVNPRTFPTGRAFALFKRVGGTYYLAAVKHTYYDPPERPPQAHIFKVVMAGGHILAYVDGVLQIEVTDTPEDDVNGTMSMPGPPFASGTVGLRTSATRAWFDDFTVIGDPAYEGRAAAFDGYVTGGINQLGTEQSLTGGDTGFQYHDHDFPSGPGGSPTGFPEGTLIGPVGTSDGTLAAGATLRTVGKGGVVTSTAMLVGVVGGLQTPLGSGNLSISITASAVNAEAKADCFGTSSKVDVVDFTYEIVFTDAGGTPVVREGKITRVSAPPNTVVLSDPVGDGGLLTITLHWRRTSSEPVRVDAAAVRIQVLQRTPGSPAPGVPQVGTGGPTAVDVVVGNVVAGRLCTPL